MMQRQVSGTYKLPYTMKAEGAGYLAGLIILGWASVMGIYGASVDPFNWWWPLAFTLPIVAWFYMLDRSEVAISKDRILYTSLSNSRTVRISNISRMQMEDSLARSMYSGGPITKNLDGRYQLLGVYDARNNKLATINVKPFSKREIAILFDAIVTEAPAVKMDERAERIKEGRYNPVTTNGAGLKQFSKLTMYLLIAMAIYEAAHGFMIAE